MVKKLEEMTDEELKRQFISLYESIYVSECFGSRDVLELEMIARELERRGYEITEEPKIRKVRKARTRGN